MRLGWDEKDLSAPFFAREFERAGVAAVTVHGRTRAQGFGGTVNRVGIRAVVEAVERMPVIGNGDVRTLPEAERMLAETGCAGVAIGRGALLNPWIFRQLDAWRRTGDPGPSPTFAQRVDLMDRHFKRLVQDRGEHFACLTFRKMAGWYCKVLRPGREIQQRLVMLGSVREFDELAGRVRERKPADSGTVWDGGESVIPVPKGPVSHW
jgi:tRNA-dihydrouridine synthase